VIYAIVEYDAQVPTMGWVRMSSESKSRKGFMSSGDAGHAAVLLKVGLQADLVIGPVVA